MTLNWWREDIFNITNNFSWKNSGGKSITFHTSKLSSMSFTLIIRCFFEQQISIKIISEGSYDAEESNGHHRNK